MKEELIQKLKAVGILLLTAKIYVAALYTLPYVFGCEYIFR